MDIRVSGFAYDSIVDGPGLRLTVFTQGCPHHCPGCHNPATHPEDGGEYKPVGEIIKMLEANPLWTGLTVSGGEPLMQPEAVLELVEGAKALGKNIWLYTGYTLEQLREKNDPAISGILSEIDVLVDGPFIESMRSLELKYMGSGNQRAIDMKKSRGNIVLFEDPWDTLFFQA